VRALRLWRYEARRAGWTALLAPPLAAAVPVLVAFADGSSGAGPAALELALPLAAGIACAGLVGRDPVAELQLTLPVPYRTTLLRRLAVTLLGTALTALAVVIAVRAAGWWPAGHGLAGGQLIWLAPVLWLAGFGFLAGVCARAPAPAAGVVAVLWVLQVLRGSWIRPLYLFATTRGTPDGWVLNRISLLATACALLAAAWLLLGRTERLVGEGN
jgi:hypothetical protein